MRRDPDMIDVTPPRAGRRWAVPLPTRIAVALIVVAASVALVWFWTWLGLGAVHWLRGGPG